MDYSYQIWWVGVGVQSVEELYERLELNKSIESKKSEQRLVEAVYEVKQIQWQKRETVPNESVLLDVVLSRQFDVFYPLAVQNELESGFDPNHVYRVNCITNVVEYEKYYSLTKNPN